MATKKAPVRKIGRPKAEVPLRSLTVNFDPDLYAAMERARARRQKTVDSMGIEITMSATVRSLLLKAIASEEDSETQPELPLNRSAESSTKKS
jgi:hypothetical protein